MKNKIIAVVGSFVICYLFFALVFFDFNIANWLLNETQRAMIAVLYFLVAVFIYIVITFGNEFAL